MSPRKRRSLAAELALAGFEKSVAAASSAAAIRGILDSPDLPDGAAVAAARAARVFDAPLLDLLLASRDTGPVLARNRHLEGWHLQRLLLWALNRTTLSTRFVPPGAPGIPAVPAGAERPWCYDRDIYLTLHVLALEGRLSRFPFALRAILRRIVGPITAPAMTLITDVMKSVQLVLACDPLPLDVLLDLDERLARCRPRDTGSRAMLARHPSAGVALWRAMLRRGVQPEMVKVLQSIRPAAQDPEVRYLLSDYA